MSVCQIHARMNTKGEKKKRHRHLMQQSRRAKQARFRPKSMTQSHSVMSLGACTPRPRIHRLRRRLNLTQRRCGAGGRADVTFLGRVHHLPPCMLHSRALFCLDERSKFVQPMRRFVDNCNIQQPGPVHHQCLMGCIQYTPVTITVTCRCLALVPKSP